MKLEPGTLYLTDEAVKRRTTIDGFVRSANVEGKTKKGPVILKFQVDRKPIVTIVAKRTDDGRWQVRTIDANLPSLLRGHNGHTLDSQHDLALALTRLRHIVSLITTSSGHDRIIPGTGRGNIGHLKYVELHVQFDDPDHRVLVASHMARLRHQQVPTGVYFGRSSKFNTRELAVSIYDKHRHLSEGICDPPGSRPTRIEAITKDAERLVTEVKKTRLFDGKPGPVVATLSPVTAMALLQQALDRLSGFGWLVDRNTLDGLIKPARLIAIALGPRIADERVLDLALKNYELSEQPCPRTMQTVENQLRAYAVQGHLGHTGKLRLSDLEDHSRANIKWHLRERDFEALMRDIKAPSDPDPGIIGAWSRTTFLPANFRAGAGYHPSAPATPPWRRGSDTL